TGETTTAPPPAGSTTAEAAPEVPAPPPPANLAEMPETALAPEQVATNLPTGRDELATTLLGQGGTTAPPADVSKFAMAPPPLTGPTTRATWFHTGAPYQSPGGRWYDAQGQREGPPASG